MLLQENGQNIGQRYPHVQHLCCMQSFRSVSFIHTYHAGAMNEVKDFILLGDASKSGINTLIQLCVKLLFFF